MNHFGFVKVAAGVPSVKVADPAYNAAQLEELIARARRKACAPWCSRSCA